ncbi:GbsR/MarR family transcriptional regulator [Bacillus paralicheniformis]|uniref:GbsR/MarR family transcriptional regulator n=1 Tax=Bacillus TaxID=1386 RepID=UPI0004252571|nr:MULTISPECIES: GbsR/MarR family transcriptional regulator [Bacillus]MBC8621396.1 GbsR/MarR family transcriptional regulator [Robertmurraya crescens]MBU8580787.1 GbsR/MarR family transcriptional regulator [Bacillus paralicheniformis]MBZ5215807.1 GbsR/MarR family transcriptional regulator [Bacillus paralicheniformis]MCY8039256.1 GbsR/MarR family transcriptional regulator [Bacillus paralicheniformis]MCY8149217.1 GbsR/MarR family transcriptional regulator [Bacillus paralicheniformis]
MEENALKAIKQAEEHFIEKIAENMNTYGISSTVGRVLGIIYMNRKPMTLNELSEETGMSKTRMSQVVREMLDLNIAEKVFEKGVRKDLYDVEQDYYQTFISLFTANWSKVVKKNRMIGKKIRKELLEALEEEGLSPETEAKINELLAETKQWIDYCEWLDNLIAFLESEEIFEHVPKPS